ncbi:hypothetical protein D3C73_628460 [compost metagenome]
MTQTLTTKVLNDFITGQGYGVAPSAVEAMARELLANLEAQPVAWASTASLKRGDIREVWPNGEQHKAGKLCITALYTAPPAPSVSNELLEAIEEVIRISDRDHDAWNRAKEAIATCRAAMLAQPVSQGCKLVPISMTDEMANAFDPQRKLSLSYLRNGWVMALAAAPEGGNEA